jgi:predicted aspartyl protease
MWKFSRSGLFFGSLFGPLSGPFLSLCFTAILLGTTSCSQNRSASNSNAAGSSAVSSAAPASSDPVAVPSNGAASAATSEPFPVSGDAYKLALEKATSAKNIGQSALSEDDWNLAASRWQQAVDYLKSLPSSSPHRAIAQTKLTEFQRELAKAKQKASQVKNNSGNGLNPGLITQGNGSLNVSSAVNTSAAGSGTLYRVPIKRRAGGTPIVDVTFNGNQTFEMIVDTGASGTVITGAMAQSLGVKIVGKTKVNTASQSGVEVPLGYVDSISVGNAVVKEVIVAIGNEALDIGLLGHDFFNDYDVTVKQDVVEFRKR